MGKMKTWLTTPKPVRTGRVTVDALNVRRAPLVSPAVVLARADCGKRLVRSLNNDRRQYARRGKAMPLWKRRERARMRRRDVAESGFFNGDHQGHLSPDR